MDRRTFRKSDPHGTKNWARHETHGSRSENHASRGVTARHWENRNPACDSRQGREIDAEELEQLRSQVAADYERQTDIRYAAARLWVDAILDPAETRSVLIQSLEIATRQASEEPFRLGVYQV